MNNNGRSFNRDTTSMDHQTRVYENIFEMMPSEENPTPLVRINRLNPHAEFPLYAKLEWMNPFGSVKDRAAWALLRDLEERGELAEWAWPGRTDLRQHRHQPSRQWLARAAIACWPLCRTRFHTKRKSY